MSSLSVQSMEVTEATPVIVCRICQGFLIEQLYHQSTFNVLRCKQCNTVFVQPTVQSVFSKLNQQANEEGERYMREVFIERMAFWLRHWTEKLKPIESLLGKKGRLLDVGCAMGYFQLAAEHQGWTSVGIEFSEVQVAYAQKVLGLDVRAGKFEDADLEPTSFDLVSLWSVIEHVSDPKEFLTKAKTYLKPDGLLVIETPNQGSLLTWLARFGYLLTGGHFLLSIYSLDHIFRFDEQTLRIVLECSGYEVVTIKQYDNLQVMLTRMIIQPHRNLRHIVLAIVHTLAAIFNKRNRLIAYARPAVEKNSGQ